MSGGGRECGASSCPCPRQAVMGSSYLVIQCLREENRRVGNAVSTNDEWRLQKCSSDSLDSLTLGQHFY
jgi:hypothetical protein